MSARHTLKSSAECPRCFTTFEGAAFDADEDGRAGAALELTACRECRAALCACCPQFACDGCGHTFCTAHKVEGANAPYAPLACCRTCAAECEELPAALPPARETRTAASIVTGTCEWCREAITLDRAQTSTGGATWHTPCFNEAAELRRAAIAGEDEPRVDANVRKPAQGELEYFAAILRRMA